MISAPTHPESVRMPNSGQPSTKPPHVGSSPHSSLGHPKLPKPTPFGIVPMKPPPLPPSNGPAEPPLPYTAKYRAGSSVPPSVYPTTWPILFTNGAGPGIGKPKKKLSVAFGPAMTSFPGNSKTVAVYNPFGDTDMESPNATEIGRNAPMTSTLSPKTRSRL